MEWLTDLGYLGLLFGTFIAGTILSLSSDILLLALLVAGGDPWICLACATCGNALGALTSYAMGWFARWEWLERWFKVRHETLEQQRARIQRFGVWGAFFSWLPVIGQVFMIALGFYKVRPVATAAITFAGCFVRFLVWVLLFVWQGDAFVEWIKTY